MPLENDTIQTDVSAPAATPADAQQQPAAPAPADPPPRSSREEMMAAIVAKRPEMLAADRDEEAARFDAARAAEEAEMSAATQLEVQTQEPVVLTDDQLANLRVRTKVNGVEQVVPLDQLRATAQKTESADRYLAEAKQLLNEVKAVGRQQPAAAPATDEPATTTPTDQTSQEADPIDEFTNALFQGDEERAKALLRKAVGQAPVNAGQIARQVEQQIVIRSALRQFAQDHREITSDPTLSRVADTFLLQATGGRSLEELPTEQVPEVLQAAGRATKEWLRTVSGLGPSSSNGPATTRSERLSRKAGIDELPAASFRSSSSEPPPQTASSVIDRMKRARGQV